jgi:hypothetical protein
MWRTARPFFSSTIGYILRTPYRKYCTTAHSGREIETPSERETRTREDKNELGTERRSRGTKRNKKKEKKGDLPSEKDEQEENYIEANEMIDR